MLPYCYENCIVYNYPPHWWVDGNAYFCIAFENPNVCVGPPALGHINMPCIDPESYMPLLQIPYTKDSLAMRHR